MGNLCQSKTSRVDVTSFRLGAPFYLYGSIANSSTAEIEIIRCTFGLDYSVTRNPVRSDLPQLLWEGGKILVYKRDRHLSI